MIGKQQKGEPGALAHTGRANLLYTASWVVDVGWRGADREGLVRAWSRGARRWGAGSRVVFPA